MLPPPGGETERNLDRVDGRVWAMLLMGNCLCLHVGASCRGWIPASAGMTELGDLAPGGEGVHVGKDEVAGAVASEPGLVLAPDYWEGVEDVCCVVLVQAVEVEVEGGEAAAQVAALLLVPRRAR